MTVDSGDDYRLPAWSADGSKIAFRSIRAGYAEIFVMDGDGTGVVQLAFDLATDTAPSWTREGTIVFSGNRSGRFEFYEMNAGDTNLRHIDVNGTSS